MEDRTERNHCVDAVGELADREGLVVIAEDVVDLVERQRALARSETFVEKLRRELRGLPISVDRYSFLEARAKHIDDTIAEERERRARAQRLTRELSAHPSWKSQESNVLLGPGALPTEEA